MDILFVEDVDSKFEDVSAVVVDAIGGDHIIARVTNLNDAEDSLDSGEFDLIVLDLSVDINSNGSVQGNGHATLGGLDVMERMSLLKNSNPVVVVTGFDSFQDPDRFNNAIMNLADIDRLATDWLGSSYIGCVRYGSGNWSRQLARLLGRWRKKQ